MLYALWVASSAHIHVGTTQIVLACGTGRAKYSIKIGVAEYVMNGGPRLASVLVHNVWLNLGYVQFSGPRSPHKLMLRFVRVTPRPYET
jgi:hypothetical protein